MARAAAPMTTSEPMVARGAPAVGAVGVDEAGSVGAPLDETTVVVTDSSEETGALGEGAPGVSEPGGTMRVVVADAGGAPGASEDGAGTAGGAPEVGTACPGGGRMMLVVDTTTGLLDSAGGGGAYEPEAVGGFSVTVTVTAGPQAQVARKHVSWCNTLRRLQAILTLDGDDRQRERSDSEELVAEHVDSGN
jgi:hypothetical protein